VLGNFFTQ